MGWLVSFRILRTIARCPKPISTSKRQGLASWLLYSIVSEMLHHSLFWSEPESRSGVHGCISARKTCLARVIWQAFETSPIAVSHVKAWDCCCRWGLVSQTQTQSGIQKGSHILIRHLLHIWPTTTSWRKPVLSLGSFYEWRQVLATACVRWVFASL